MYHPDPRRLIKLAEGVLWFQVCLFFGLGFSVPPRPLLSLVPVAVLLITVSINLNTTTRKTPVDAMHTEYEYEEKKRDESLIGFA